MINTKHKLQFYLAADKFALGKKYRYPRFNDNVWKFQIALRKLEYYTNVNSKFKFLYKYKKYKLGLLLGFDIPINVFGPGLRINHFGNIVIHNAVRVGAWCDLHQGVNIGSNNSPLGDKLVPIIGDHVWIGPGAKIFGKININNNVVIGANAVVFSDISLSVTVGGCPAKTIKHSGTENIKVMANESNKENFFLHHPEFLIYKK